MNNKIDLGCKSMVMQYSDADISTILAKYDRKPETVYQDIEIIRSWLKTQPHITLESSDRQIVAFLMANKFSIERTKEKLDMYCTIKNLIPEYYSLPLMHADIRTMYEAYTYCPLPKLTKDLNRVYISKCENSNIFLPAAMFSIVVNALELATITDVCNSNEFVIDLQNATVSWLSKQSLMDFKKLSTILEKVYSNRIAAIHVINFQSFAMPLYNLIKRLFKQKIQDRVTLDPDAIAMHKYYSKEILPKDYGGDEKTIMEIKENWLRYMEENKEYLEKMQKMRSNEELRPQKLVNDDVLGFHGNFKKLDVD